MVHGFLLARRIVAGTRRYSSLSLLGKSYETDSVTNLPQSIIQKLPLRLHNQPNHPISILKSLIEAHFAVPGHYNSATSPFAAHPFKAHSSLSPIVTTFQNFDQLSFPKDHPGRAPSDSYYINKDVMLRTHTSAHEVECFTDAANPRWLLTADVYRRDEIDSSHYPVFHQMEGARIFPATHAGMNEVKESNKLLTDHLARGNIIIEDVPHISPTNPVQPTHDPAHSSLVAQNLKLSLNSMILALFGNNSSPEPLRVRWIEAYFPFTSPSFEVEVFYRGKWLEILGSGVVRQATLDLAGVPDKLGWAFGLGLERIAMVLFSIPDIRLFWSQDKRFLEQFKGDITTFKPYSKYPSCFKDVSFWLSPEKGLHDNDFCDLVRDVAGDLVETVEKIDEFKHPKTGRHSLCFRINYCSMDRSLTNEETNHLHERVVSQLRDKFEVEIR